MSQENVEIARRMLEAWNRGDMAAFGDQFHPDAVSWPAEGWPEPGPYLGREAIMRQLQQMRETWDADLVEPISDFIDAGDRVLVRLIWRGVGHGPQSSMEVTSISMLRKGKVVFSELFWDHAEALEAIGLLEQ
jgi:ketosteroid isomerase-like protein